MRKNRANEEVGLQVLQKSKKLQKATFDECMEMESKNETSHNVNKRFTLQPKTRMRDEDCQYYLPLASNIRESLLEINNALKCVILLNKTASTFSSLAAGNRISKCSRSMN